MALVADNENGSQSFEIRPRGQEKVRVQFIGAITDATFEGRVDANAAWSPIVLDVDGTNTSALVAADFALHRFVTVDSLGLERVRITADGTGYTIYSSVRDPATVRGD